MTRGSGPMTAYGSAARRTTRSLDRRGRVWAKLAGWVSFPIVMWVALWLSINTGPWQFSEFGSGFGADMDAVRAGLPLVVLALAVLSLITAGRRHRDDWVERALWAYGLIMLLACTGAENWFDQAYWGFAFLAALAVAASGIRHEEALALTARLNWASWLMTSLVLLAMLFVARDVLYAPDTGSSYNVLNRFQDAYGYTISRSTGLSRMAAIPAIISLVFVFSGPPWKRLASLAVLCASIYVIWIMQARGALFAFVGAFLFVMFLGERKAQKASILILIAVGLFAVLGSSSGGSLHDVWLHATRGEGSDAFGSMSGRDVIRQNAIERIAASPLFGYGPQADRLFADVGNAQNAVLYALLCAGIVGAFFFLVAFLLAWRALIFLIRRIRRLEPRERRMVQITGGILVFATLRSIPENNAALFSIDLLLQFPAMLYLATLRERLVRESRQPRAVEGSALWRPAGARAELWRLPPAINR